MQPRQIFLFSAITNGSAEFIIQQLLSLDRESNEEITMFINSPGGSVVAMFAIVDVMQMIKSSIRTVVIGQSASAAAVISAMGDTRLITESSEYMIHEVWGFMMGSTTEMQENADRVKKMQTNLLKMLSRSSGMSVDKLENMIKKTNKFFTAKEAVRFGFADKIIKSNEAQLLKLSEGINAEGYEFSSSDTDGVTGMREVQLLREGRFSHPTYGEILLTESNLSQMIENFNNKVRGIDISLDYTHDNEGGESPAACWIKQLEMRDTVHGKGLFAHVEFTPKGLDLVSKKEYKYASADFSIDYMSEDEKHFPYVLRGGTLTNRPFIKEMKPIKLSEYNPVKEEIKNMNKEALFSALKDLGIDVVNIQASLETANSKVEELQAQIKELSTLPTKTQEEVNMLKEKLAEAQTSLVNVEKEKVFNALVAEGKVLPAQKDSIFNTFDTAEKVSEYYKDAPVVVNVKGSGHEDNIEQDELTEAEAKLVEEGTYTKEDILKNRTIDG